jgi:hypothetical protein
MTRKLQSIGMLAALALAGPLACDNVTSAGDTSLRVLLTDAPSDYIAAASVDIGLVELIGAEGGPVTLSTNGTDGLVNLLELQNAATATLAQADIEAGRYAQIRLIVEAARVELAEGFQFNDGTTERDLFIPSGAQTGIKLNLAGADGEGGEGSLEIVPGEMVLVLDFDVNQSFVIQGEPEGPAGINGVLFTPTLRVTVQDVAASISGTVSTSLGGVSVEGLVVTAEPTDEGTHEEFQTATATAVTAADGTYTVHFLVPGTYAVSVEAPEGTVADPASQSVSVGDGENAAAVDFEVVGG